VDANMAWTVDRALEMLPVLARHRIEFLEQPLPADDHEGLRRLNEKMFCRSLPMKVAFARMMY